MTHLRRIAGFIPVLALSLGGCVASTGADEENIADASRAIDAIDAARVLELANYPGTDGVELDMAVGLDSRAASNIIAYRNGADGVSPSADDNLFDNLAELDAVPFVGDAAFQRLSSYAAAHPAPSGETVEGVVFAGWQAEAIVWGVNGASTDELDVEVGLDARAAGGLVQRAPFATVTAMGPVGYVGAAALQKLLNHASSWWSEMSGGPGGVCADQLATDLAPTIEGLLYPSESDYPFVPLARATTKTGKITASELKSLVGLPSSTPTEIWSLDHFFRDYLLEGDDGAKYSEMRRILESDLTDLTVIRTGHIQITIYIVGRTACGEVAGLSTVSIET